MQTKVSEYFENGYILVADDEPNMRRTIKNMLNLIGIKDVVEAEDGNIALDILREKLVQPVSRIPVSKRECVFVLSDWNMKYMSGVDFAREIRGEKRFENIPIVMITANLDTNYVTRAVEAGINGYIIKPLTPAILEAKIKNVLESRANPPAHIKLINIGEMLLEQGNYEEALEQFEQAREMRPDSARVHVLLGESHEKLKQYKEAGESYEKATAANPRYLKGHTSKANFHMQHGDKNVALKSLEQAAVISPNNPERQTTIGHIYLEDGKVEKAKSAFSVAIKQDPKKNKEIGELYLKAGKAQDAEKFFRESLKHIGGRMSQAEKEEAIHTFNRLGIALRRQSRWNDAVLEYENSLKIDPNDEALYYNMGKAYLEGSKKDDAAKCFKKALLIDPRFTEAKEALEKLEHKK